MLDKWRPVQTWLIVLAAQSSLLKQSVRCVRSPQELPTCCDAAHPERDLTTVYEFTS
jgi:hypothetical protein